METTGDREGASLNQTHIVQQIQPPANNFQTKLTPISQCVCWRRFDKRPEKYHLAITIFLSDARLWHMILNLAMAVSFVKRVLLSKMKQFMK